MFIRVASDLHLEAFKMMPVDKLALRVLPVDTRDSESVLALAGDISSSPEQLVNFLYEIETRFAKVIYIPGNHEYYRHDYHTWAHHVEQECVESLRNTVYAFNSVGHLVFEGVSFFYCTLWADGGSTPLEHIQVERGLYDFRLIKYQGDKFTVARMQEEHRAQKNTLEQYLKEYQGVDNRVVITHHMPSYRLCHPRFGNEINGGFASNCDDILAYDHAPNIWIHGHTHDTVDTTLWKTRIVCNPLGYPIESNSQYNSYSRKFIEL